MKNKYYLYILPLCAVFLFNGKKYDESVIDRIHINVNICLEGQECGEVAMIADTGNVSKGTKLYAGCIACHGAKGKVELGLHSRVKKVTISQPLSMNIRIILKEARKVRLCMLRQQHFLKAT